MFYQGIYCYICKFLWCSTSLLFDIKCLSQELQCLGGIFQCKECSVADRVVLDEQLGFGQLS